MSRDEQTEHVRGPQAASIGAVIRRARHTRCWTQPRLAHQMQLAARQKGWPVPKAKSLVVCISRWERGERRPNRYSKVLLSVALGLSRADLQIQDD